MKRLIVFILSVTALVGLEAALPPLAQSKREIEAILSSRDLGNFVPNSDVIVQIVKTPSGYLIITNNRIVPVSIRYVGRDSLGPARFTVWFHKPIETGNNKPGDHDGPASGTGDHCEENFWKGNPQGSK